MGKKKDELEGERPIGVRAIKVGGKDLGITREGEGEGRTVGEEYAGGFKEALDTGTIEE